MSQTGFKVALKNVIREALNQPTRPSALNLRSSGLGARPGRAPSIEEIADDLAQQAVASANPLSNHNFRLDKLSGGNTAELVAVLSLEAPFILKLDSVDAKLAREGAFLREVRAETAFPERFRDAWPIVYAIRDQPPFAYLMEYFPPDQGWRSLEDRLYPKPGLSKVSKAQAQRLLNAALDTLFTGYDARQQRRLIPSIDADYVGRLRERLSAAALRDSRFSSRPIAINAEAVEPWETYLTKLERNKAYLATISPSFATIAHGDPNPGNIILSADPSSIRVKLIDPKDWREGDYLFDIAKITHFLECTGPIEKPADGTAVAAACAEGDSMVSLRYTIARPDWTEDLVGSCLDRVEQFALKHGDTHWRARYELGMAANLLGLPDGRLRSGRPEAALALFGEGLIWLKRFCTRLLDAHAHPRLAIEKVPQNVLEPDSIADVRNFVRRQSSEVREAEDPRGFQLLHWQPAATTADANAKLLELSLEHEARLMPSSEGGLRALEAALGAAAVDGQTVNGSLLPKDFTFGHLRMSRFSRAPGSQSTDHYWDAPSAPPELRLIGQMLSLRQRVARHDRISWSAVHDRSSLTFELPIVAIGDSGVVARLEFNWAEDIQVALQELGDSNEQTMSCHPLVLARRRHIFARKGYQPLIEHTTFREKFAISGDTGEGSLEPWFHLNVDHTVAQSLRSRRIATYTDVDIAPARKVDAEMLDNLIAFTEAISGRYELIPIGASKAWRDASLVGELG